MTAEEVRQQVVTAIGDDWAVTNWHGVDLRRCLLDVPRTIQMTDVSGTTDQLHGWLVLEEHPDTHLGYGVVYVESEGQYGLVQFVQTYDPCLMGIYGDFHEALAAM